MKEYQFSEWKTRNKNYRSGGGRVNEKIRFRDFDVDSSFRVEEGMIVSHDEKSNEKDAKYYPAQQQLTGYHYIALVDDKNKDRLWVQGHMRHISNYAIFSSDGHDSQKVEQNWTGETVAFDKFKKMLEDKGIKIDGKSLGNNNIIVNEIKCFEVGKDFLDCEIKKVHITNDLKTLEIRKPTHNLTTFSGHLNKMPSKETLLYDRQDLRIDHQEKSINFNRAWEYMRLKGVQIK